jgi:molybdate transport repressor ModE-like protein
MQVKGNIWIEENDGVKVGKGRAVLLQKIKQGGSIADAARQLKMPYRKAWAMVKEMNKNKSNPVVEKAAGGTNGGGAHLTERGKELLEAFSALTNEFEKFQNGFISEK